MPRVRIELTTFRWLYLYVIMRLTRCLLRYRGTSTLLRNSTLSENHVLPVISLYTLTGRLDQCMCTYNTPPSMSPQ